MSSTISFADWVDWLAVELTFVELYRSATRSEKRELTETVRRLATGIGETDVEAFVSQVPNLERALGSFSPSMRDLFRHFLRRLCGWSERLYGGLLLQRRHVGGMVLHVRRYVRMDHAVGFCRGRHGLRCERPSFVNR